LPPISLFLVPPFVLALLFIIYFLNTTPPYFYYKAASTLPVTATVKDSEQWTTGVDWTNKENQRAYLDWLGHQFSYKQLSDWYGVKLEDFTATKGGQALMKVYSHPSIVSSFFFPASFSDPLLVRGQTRGLHCHQGWC
jgi:hypothetical protein